MKFGSCVAATVSYFTLLTATMQAITNLISWFSVFDFIKDYQTGRWWDILACVYVPKIITVWPNFGKL